MSGGWKTKQQQHFLCHSLTLWLNYQLHAPRNWRSTFGVCPIITMSVSGQFAKILSPDSLQKMPITLKSFGIFWQDLAQGIAKWHLSSAEAWPSLKFWKFENGTISWTEWKLVMQFCIHIDIDKIYIKGLSNAIYIWSRLCRASNSGKKKKTWNWQYLLNFLEYFDRILHTY